MYHSGISMLLPTHLLGELVGRDPGHCLTMDVCLIVYALDRQKNLWVCIVYKDVNKQLLTVYKDVNKQLFTVYKDVNKQLFTEYSGEIALHPDLSQ